MDDFSDCDPPIAAPPNTASNLVVGGLLLTLAVVPPLLVWLMDDTAWFWGWAILLILGLAG